MTRPVRVRVTGSADLGVQQEIPGSLEELIYQVTVLALEDASLTIDDIDAVCMGASDLLDGRAISTMTLTGSTGSLRKSELRVCDDGLGAVTIAATEIVSGAARRMTVSAWSKLSDVDLASIDPLSLEPTFHRGLGIGQREILGLRESHTRGVPTVIGPPRGWPADTAVAVVLTAEEIRAADEPTLIGFGGAMGSYLLPGESLLTPLSKAAGRACDAAGCSASELTQVFVAGTHDVTEDDIRRELGLADVPVVPLEPQGAEVGYAAGMLALRSALRVAPQGRSLVAVAGGVGLQSAHALVMEVR